MNALKTTLLLGAMTGLLLAMGEVLGGRSGMILALVLAGVMNFGAWFWSDKIVLRMYSAQPVGASEAPELYAIVEGLAKKAGMPMPKLYVIPDPALNAFATGRSPSHAAVAATEGIVRGHEPRGAGGRPRPRAVARASTATPSSRRWRPPWPAPSRCLAHLHDVARARPATTAATRWPPWSS